MRLPLLCSLLALLIVPRRVGHCAYNGQGKNLALPSVPSSASHCPFPWFAGCDVLDSAGTVPPLGLLIVLGSAGHAQWLDSVAHSCSQGCRKQSRNPARASHAHRETVSFTAIGTQHPNGNLRHPRRGRLVNKEKEKTSFVRRASECRFVLRAFTTLEGIGKTLDPNYSFSAVATPYARELLDLQITPQNGAMVLAAARDQAFQLTQNTAAAPGRVEYLENTLRRYASLCAGWERLPGGNACLVAMRAYCDLP